MTGDFWQTWKEFEVKHGNEDTLREMLRVKRSVQAVYNTQVNMMASAMMKETGGLGTVSDLTPSLTLGLKDDMWRLEAKGAESDVKNAGGGAGGAGGAGSNIMFIRGETQSQAVHDSATAENPDEIDISDEEDDEAEPNDAGETAPKKVSNVEELDVPDAVFGGLKKSDEK